MSEILVANGVLVQNPYSDLKKWSACSMYVSVAFYCFLLVQPGYDELYFLALLLIPIFPYICLRVGLQSKNSIVMTLYVSVQCVFVVTNVSMLLFLGKQSKFYRDACNACHFRRETQHYCIVNKTGLVTEGVVDEMEEMNLGTIRVLTHAKCTEIATNTAIYSALYMTMIYMNAMTIRKWRKVRHSVLIKTVLVQARDIEVIDIAPDAVLDIQHCLREEAGLRENEGGASA